jgi:hypothetical protein
VKEYKATDEHLNLFEVATCHELCFDVKLFCYRCHIQDSGVPGCKLNADGSGYFISYSKLARPISWQIMMV